MRTGTAMNVTSHAFQITCETQPCNTSEPFLIQNLGHNVGGIQVGRLPTLVGVRAQACALRARLVNVTTGRP